MKKSLIRIILFTTLLHHAPAQAQEVPEPLVVLFEMARIQFNEFEMEKFTLQDSMNILQSMKKMKHPNYSPQLEKITTQHYNDYIAVCHDYNTLLSKVLNQKIKTDEEFKEIRLQYYAILTRMDEQLRIVEPFRDDIYKKSLRVKKGPLTNIDKEFLQDGYLKIKNEIASELQDLYATKKELTSLVSTLQTLDKQTSAPFTALYHKYAKQNQTLISQFKALHEKVKKAKAADVVVLQLTVTGEKVTTIHPNFKQIDTILVIKENHSQQCADFLELAYTTTNGDD
ncbi:MAG: hypothetical protein ACRCWQ_08640 [Bacilli bacterium]